MGLSLLDCEEGTLVDHTFERREDGKLVSRDIIRRGIIVKVEGNRKDQVSAIHVKFSMAGEPELIRGDELVRFLPAISRQAREAYRRITGTPKHVGAEFTARKSSVRRKIQDPLALTPKKREGMVAEEYKDEEEGDEIGGMDLGPQTP